MSTYRRSSFIVAAFLFIWLITSLSYSMGTQCMCCSPTEKHGTHHGKKHADKCCSPLDDSSKKCQCHCISCGKSRDKEIAAQKKFIASFEKDERAGLSQLTSDTISSIREQKETHYQHTTFPLKFLSLYLIKESFLL